MKLNKFFMLGLAGLAFAACSNDDEVDNSLTQGTKQVTVTVLGSGMSRATQPNFSGADGETVAINANDIDIYFLDGEGKVIGTPQAMTGSTTVFHNISNEVTQIAAVGNFEPETTPTTITALKEAMVDVTEKQAVTTVPVFADATVLTPSTAHTDTSHEDDEQMMYQASLTLTTQISRFEIGGSMTCTNLGGAYTRLDLEYVGINKAVSEYQLGTTSTTSYEAKNNQYGFPVLTDQTDVDGTTVLEKATPTAFYETVFTEGTPNTYQISLTQAGVPSGDFTNVLAFNTVGMPVITFKFDPTVNPDSEGTILPNDPAYLKIVGMEGETVKAGYIYRFEDLTFEEEDLTPLVKDQICITATVAVTPFTVKVVEPVYGE